MDKMIQAGKAAAVNVANTTGALKQQINTVEKLRASVLSSHEAFAKGMPSSGRVPPIIIPPTGGGRGGRGGEGEGGGRGRGRGGEGGHGGGFLEGAAVGAARATIGGRFTHTLTNAWFGEQLAHMAVHGLDSAVEIAAEVDSAKKRLALALPKDQQNYVEEALNQAKAMSQRFGNMTIAENMHIISDLRANLTDAFPNILKEALPAFAQLGSFLKTFEGGKHEGTEGDLLRDFGLAIRSGELAGDITAEDLAHHAKALAVANLFSLVR
jgi:hypothetical protein